MKTSLLLITGLVLTTLSVKPNQANIEQHSEKNIEWVSLETAQELSKETGKPVFVFFEAEWCGICKRMLRTVFPQTAVENLLNDNYHVVSIDLDSKKKILFNNKTLTERNFARELEIIATPTILFLNSNGSELGRFRGYLDSDDFARLLVYVRSDEFGEVLFENYTIP